MMKELDRSEYFIAILFMQGHIYNISSQSFAKVSIFVYSKQSKIGRWEGLSIINTVGRNAGEDCAKVKLLQVRFTEMQVRNVG